MDTQIKRTIKTQYQIAEKISKNKSGLFPFIIAAMISLKYNKKDK